VRRYPHRRLIPWAWPFVAVLGCCSLSACNQAANTNAVQVDNASSPIGTEISDTDRLKQLRVERERDSFKNKLTIGPGDVIEVSVPRVPELNRFKVRVSEDNTISIPLAGVVHVRGMSEEELREALYNRLAKPMKNPDVQVFMDQYQSRDVAVVGMVQKAGLYSISSRADTVLAMINRAGGMTEQASSRVLFIPASAASNSEQVALAKGFAAQGVEALGKVQPVRADMDGAQRQMGDPPDRILPDHIQAGSSLDSTASQDHMLSLLGATDPIEIDLTTARSERELDVPVRPGDTIIVPAAGEVMVDGWVRSPGAFRIVPGMTAVSAVAAAGGALFSEEAEVLRTDTSGTRRAIPLDLADVKAGNKPDVPVQEGDVVVVKHSPIGVVPYALYEIFTKFGTGMYLPVP
jgi:protein involved in polysaccharide export with SLBB domain